jgi:hypothetical protein
MDDDLLSKALSSFTATAFCLELRPRYNVTSEQDVYRRYMAGDPTPVANPKWNEFIDVVTKEGRQMSRLRVIPRRLTEYIRFEITCGYAFSSRRGEDIRFLGQEHVTVPGGLQDFWLFDSDYALELIYDQKDQFMGAKPVLSALIPDLITAQADWMGKATSLKLTTDRMRRGQI